MPVFLVQSYRLVPLTQRARKISMFVTPSGLYQYKVMPFGMKNVTVWYSKSVSFTALWVVGHFPTLPHSWRNNSQRQFEH